MRITDDRYSRHRRCLDLAWRLIQLEARTRTISQWTQLSGHRIRRLCKSYASSRNGLTRHRGMSPYKLELILSSPQSRCEAAIFAGICRTLHLLPEQKPEDVERMLPSVDRGELVCDAYEWFRCEVPNTRITIEHAFLLLNELARGEEVQLGTCKTCAGVILVDRFSLGRLECVFCSTGIEDVQRELA